MLGLCYVCTGGLPEDGSPVPKLVGVDTYNELYCMICILLSETIG